MRNQTARAATPPSPILLRETLGSVAVLTLNRPAARNSLSEAMIAGLHAALNDIADDKNIRALVIAANGPAFSAGHDMKELTARRSDPDRHRARYRPRQPCCSRGQRTRRRDCARTKGRAEIRLHRKTRQDRILPAGRDEPCRRLSLCVRSDDREHAGA